MPFLLELKIELCPARFPDGVTPVKVVRAVPGSTFPVSAFPLLRSQPAPRSAAGP